MNEKKLNPVERAAYQRIRNALVHGTRPPTTRELSAALGYKSPRSGALLVNRLIELGFLYRRKNSELQLVADLGDKDGSHTVSVPLVGSVSCGSLLLAQECVDTTIAVSTRLVPPPYKYFVLRAQGDSMDQKGINDGDLVLVRQQCVARDGDSVVALVDDDATIKEFHLSESAITLRPRSSNPAHQPIVLAADFQIQGVVVTVVPKGRA